MLTDQQLIELQQNRQEGSDWVLNRLGLIPILEQYGEVKMVGAKALGLMVAKDIDISVLVKKIEVGEWQKLVGELMEAPYVRNVSAIDYYHYDTENTYNPDNGQKYSLFVSVNNIMGSEDNMYDTWECQIHLIEPNKFDEKFVTSLIGKLTDENRLTILRLKYWADTVNVRLKSATNNNFKIFSPTIYKAVLENSIGTVEKFVEHFRPSVPEKFKRVFEESI